MYKVELYHDAKGRSELLDTLRKLEDKSSTDKEARTAYLSMLKAISELEGHGTRIGMPTVRHVRGEIWELRPKSQRVFFFFWKDNTFVLLHSYTKKTQKTPRREIMKAERKKRDWIARHADE